MANFVPFEFTTNNAEELAYKLSSFFAPHHYRLGSGASSVTAGFRLGGDDSLPILTHWWGVPVDIEPEPFVDCYVIATSLQGQGWIQSGREEAVCRPNAVLALPPSGRYKMGFDSRYRSHTVRVRRDMLHALNERWTGRSAECELDFALRPVDQNVSTQWSYAMSLLSSDSKLSPIARSRLTEYALALLIEGHPHQDRSSSRASNPSLGRKFVRDAEDFIKRKAYEPITVSSVAEAIGCSVRSLQAAFKTYLRTTPREYLALVRMNLAREALMNPSQDTKIADVAMRLGFTHLGRFSSAFRKQFGEYPAHLLRRRRGLAHSRIDRQHAARSVPTRVIPAEPG